MYNSVPGYNINNIPDNIPDNTEGYSLGDLGAFGNSINFDGCLDDFKKAKWSSEAKKFFEYAEKDSLTLNIIISLSCKSQTGEAFEELVNTLNDPQILQKTKKINILDTTYLYRHFVPDFARYNDVSIPTEWYLSNQKSIEKLKAKVELKCWADEINTEEYRNALQKVMRDFRGDEDGQGLIMEFRDTVIAEAATNAYKHKQDLKACIKFIIEECAHLLASFGSGGIIVYPMKLYSAGDYMISKHHLNIKHLSYKVGVGKDGEDGDSKLKKSKEKSEFIFNPKIPGSDITASDVEAAVTNFMKNEVSNLNFFVVNRKGKLIYSNFALNKLIDKNKNASEIDENAWVRTYEVIRSGKMFVGEEQGRKGRTYLSMKAPLWIEGEIHGAIGLSIDVTDNKRVALEKKRSMDLEFLSRLQEIKLKIQEEFSYFISQMAHDISAPLAMLELFEKSCDGISCKEKCTLKKIAEDIKDISNKCFEKYRNSQKELEFSKKHCVLIALTLFEVINKKKAQLKKSDIKIHFFYDPSLKYSFVDMDQDEFLNMISSLIDMAVQNCKETQKPMVNVRLIQEKSRAIVEVISNNCDLQKDFLDKEHKISIQKIHDVLESCGGTLKFSKDKDNKEKEEGESNGIVVSLPLAEPPQWISTQIDLRRDSVVMIFDNDLNANKQWEKLFGEHINTVKLKVLSSDDENTKNYIKALSSTEKENIYALINYESTHSASENVLNTMMQYGLMKRSVVMTAAYNDNRLREVVLASGAKILPKQFLKGINVVLQ